MLPKIWSRLCQMRLFGFVVFYFLDMGGAAEGNIGVNWPNIAFMLLFIATGFGLGKLL